AANASFKHATRLYRFGYYVGMSFQMMDDVLDFTGSEKQLGKPAGSDLQQGNITLPAIYTLYQSSTRSLVVDYLSTESSDNRFNDVLHVIRTSGGIEYAQQLSQRYLQKAFQSLEDLPDIEAKSSLYEIAKYMGNRKS